MVLANGRKAGQSTGIGNESGHDQMKPTALYHYYEYSQGPFRNLSDLPMKEAQKVQRQLKQTGKGFASKRSDDYMSIRRELEDKARRMFIAKGGTPLRSRPHYLTLGETPWLQEWYTDTRKIELPIEDFNPQIISFTYGDLFPTMRYGDDKPYRKQVFTMQEIFSIIDEFGLPQEWNRDGLHGPERYIEAQVWDDKPLLPYLRKLNEKSGKEKT